MDSEPEFAEEYTTQERIRFIVLYLLASALVVFSSKKWLFPWIGEFAASAPCRKVFGIEGLTVFWYGLFVGLPLQATILAGIFIGWRGYRILRDGQVPPAKEKVCKPTRIIRGSKAKLIGYLHLSVVLLSLVLTVFCGFQATELISQTKPQYVRLSCVQNK